jgi:hypothetical protein
MSSRESQFAPWYRFHGVVSLLEMLEFAAQDFVEISHRLGMLRGIVNRTAQADDVLQNSFGDLLVRGSRLGLTVTTSQILSLLKEHHENASPEIQRQNHERLQRRDFRISGQMDVNRAAYYAESIYSTLHAELDSMLFRAIPKERTRYWKSWLKDTLIGDRFPSAHLELERAGRCYSLGEPIACVFHSMRALEPGLGALARNFQLEWKHENWQAIINSIEAKIRGLGDQPKSETKVADEKFFGEAATHFYFIKNAWRNHVVHGRDSYGDGEAEKIMQHTADFVQSLCPRLSESP